jgi:aspartate-semialdehyde dehydrogenase
MTVRDRIRMISLGRIRLDARGQMIGQRIGDRYHVTTMRVAVVGATGAVGRQMVRILEERAFPVDELISLASERTAGTRLQFGGEEHEVCALSLDALDGVDVALSSCGSSVAKTWIPAAAAGGTTCIDNSSAFRMDPSAALTIPEVNPESLDASPRIVSVPNCTIITTLMAVAPLHRAAGLRSLIVSSYQSVSGAGAKGVRELAEQVEKLHGMEEDLAHPDLDALPVGDVFGKTIAYNVVAKIDAFDTETGFTLEEIKMQREAKRILSMPNLDVTATCVRVPVPVGHSVSIHATFDRPISPDEAREVLGAAPGLEVRDDPANDVYPSPIEAAGRDEVLVGRIRRPEGHEDALLLFACADNLRKGAALNAVQIAEHLFA